MCHLAAAQERHGQTQLPTKRVSACFGWGMNLKIEQQRQLWLMFRMIQLEIAMKSESTATISGAVQWFSRIRAAGESGAGLRGPVATSGPSPPVGPGGISAPGTAVSQ